MVVVVMMHQFTDPVLFAANFIMVPERSANRAPQHPLGTQVVRQVNLEGDVASTTWGRAQYAHNRLHSAQVALVVPL